MKKNILILHSSSDLYGASKILLITAAFLKKSGHNVFVCLSQDGPLVAKLKEEQIETLICRLGILRRKYFSPQGFLNRLYVIHKAKKEISKFVKEQKIDVLYSNTTGVLVGAMVAKKCNVKHIWHVHEIIDRPKFFTQFIGKMLNRYSDRVIVVSKEVEKHWMKYITNKGKLLTIYNGLDYSAFLNPQPGLRNELGLSNDHVLIGMIGRVNLWKGQGYFLQMATLIQKKFPNARFVMTGDAYPGYEYLYDELNGYIKRFNLQDVVYTLGFRTDIPYILQGLDIFVLPSVKPDPLPTVILEAMASGKPVVATQHGGALEMVKHLETGILVPWDKPEESVQQFSSLIKDNALRNELGTNGRKRVSENFSLEKFKTNMIELINSL